MRFQTHGKDAEWPKQTMKSSCTYGAHQGWQKGQTEILEMFWQIGMNDVNEENVEKSKTAKIKSQKWKNM